MIWKALLVNRLKPKKRTIPRWWSGFLLVGLAVGLGGCFSSSKLQKNEYLLYSQNIRGNRIIPGADLEALIPQKPNRRILRLPITPYLWFYLAGSRRYNREAVQQELEAKIKESDRLSEAADSTKAYRKRIRRFNREITRLRRKAEEGNWIMRTLGEPPVYFQVADAQANAEKLQRYLYNKGFLLGKVTYAVDSILGRRVRVNYRINENIPFNLRSITYLIADPRVDSIVRRSLDQSLLKVGDRFDAENVGKERVRIEELLRNHGYYAFSRQYVLKPEASDELLYNRDSSSRELDIWLTIANPPGRQAHPIYHIGEVDVRIARSENRPALDTVQRNGIRFFLGRQNYSTRLLDSKIFLRPDSLYRIANYRETQRQLFLLNQFKFANVNFSDTTNRRLRTSISLIPIDKYELTAETGLNVNNFNINTIIPGPFVNFGLQIHNAFGGLETFEASVRGSIEGAIGYEREVYIGTQYGVNLAVNLPHILFPGSFRFRFNSANPKTQVSVGYNYVDRPEFTRANARANLSYSWQKNTKHLFTFSLSDINLLYTNRLSRSYDSLLRGEYDKYGNPLIFSFKNSTILSSMIFTYSYNTNNLGINNRGNFFRVSLESGGTTLNFLNERWLTSISRQTGLNFYKYLRTNLDYRHYVPLKGKSLLAFRLNTGLLYTYYYSTQDRTSPYEKYFFAGGSNSIRAWRLRALGYGSTYPRTTLTKDPEGNYMPDIRRGDREGQFNYQVERPAEFLLEGSAELRGPLFKIGFADINYALFTDIGNTWRIYDTGESGARFRFGQGPNPRDLPFYRQFAVGSGVGLRIDMSYFIIRFDAGVKVYDPSRRYYDETSGRFIDERFFLPYFRFDKMFKGPNPLVVQFGIGYPF